jgi:hypothetical protein
LHQINKNKKMRKLYFFIAIALIGFSAKLSAQTTIIKDSVATSQTWTNDKMYLIQGFVYVVNGVTLTIEPGTIIKGDHTLTGSSLIVERGAKLNAIGTAVQPIIFTSDMPAGSRSRGDWGGIILCGKAPINTSGGQSQIEGGPRSYYGGTDANDNSGTLQYVRVEFAGYPFQANKEINGLTFGGVGKGTTIDHIQVSYSNDDSYEWFGGNVDCKYLIAFRGLDDDFDTDYGFSGKGQYFIALRDSAVADVSGSNGFESDNDATGSSNTPYTSPLFANVGLFGPKVDFTNPVNPLFKRGMHIRRNSRLSCYNSVFAGWPTGMYIDGDNTDANANNNDLQIENCIISGMSKFFDVPSGQTWSVASARNWYFDASRHNDTLATNNLLQITDPFNYSSPNFIPLTGSPLNGKALWTNPRLASDIWFDKVTYAGPMGTIDWTSPWANWNPQNTVYALSVSENTLTADQVNVYPNPASGNTSVEFNLNNDEKVKIEVIDLSGRNVIAVQNGNLSRGTHHISFDVSHLPTGAYFVRIGLASSSVSKKIFICR